VAAFPVVHATIIAEDSPKGEGVSPIPRNDIKSTVAMKRSQEDLDRIIHMMNNTPRKCLS
jgi:hypothetical protein